MAVCHTVVPERDPDDNSLIYQASSPGKGTQTGAPLYMLYDLVIFNMEIGLLINGTSGNFCPVSKRLVHIERNYSRVITLATNVFCRHKVCNRIRFFWEQAPKFVKY